MKTLLNILIIAGLMFGMAYMYIQGWDKQYEIDSKARDNKMHTMIERGF